MCTMYHYVSQKGDSIEPSEPPWLHLRLDQDSHTHTHKINACITHTISTSTVYRRNAIVSKCHPKSTYYY